MRPAFRRPATRRRMVARTRAVVAAGAVLATVAGQLPSIPAQAAAPSWRPLTVQAENVVRPGTKNPLVPYSADPAAGAARRTAAAPAWPQPGSATVDRAVRPGMSAADTMTRAGTLPISVGLATAGAARPVGAAGAKPATAVKARVEALAQPATTRPGGQRDSLLLRVTSPEPVKVSVNYTMFASGYGADWAGRLRLVALPECALSTPDAAGCVGTPLPTANDGATVSADVAAGSALLALAPGPSGPSGNFTATPLAPSAYWSAGSSSGDFTWSYPLRVPPSLGGPAPQLALSYSAQSVDGHDAASNNQPSWLGEGWQMSPGYIERRYTACADDGVVPKNGDLCWAKDNAVLSLGDHGGELIRDDATGAWHTKVDDGSRIEHLTGAPNGDNDGEYWKVTAADGTQYWFGRNHLPGWTSGKPEANSTWTVPVYGNNAGEPCHDTSWCQQAWRWNLDYVVDSHGNTMSYRYATESNSYGREADPSKATSYIRGGYPTEADYGTRTEAEYGTAPMRVQFGVANRCLPGTPCTSSDPQDWPDVPWDQSCTAAPCDDLSPTFFTTKRLSTVVTQVWGGSAYRDVDSWTLAHTYPDPGDGTRAGLWLAGVSHTGKVGGTASMPNVTFTGVQMPNRVDTLDSLPAMNWWRLASVRTETGGEISVRYSAPDCVAGSRMPSAPESNTLRCYPVKWIPPGSTVPVMDYFHKYVATDVVETDHTGGSPGVVTHYDYLGSPAWHHTDDEVMADAYKTWSQWRGYERVQVTKGQPGEQSRTETRYFRGMDGDQLPSGTRHVSITDSRGGTWVDSDPLAGRVRESLAFNGPGGAEVSSALFDPWLSAPTASHAHDGITEQARMVNTTVALKRTALDRGRGTRISKAVTSFDQYGLPVQIEDLGDVADTGDDQCTKYTYARNTDLWLVNYVSRTQSYGLGCDQTPNSAQQVISDGRTSFDGQPWGTPPSKGDATQVEQFKDLVNGTPTYLVASRGGYDSNGRITQAWDVEGNLTTTSYTPSGGAPVTRVSVTNQLGWVTTSDMEPAWGVVTGTTDPNGRRSDTTYDPLGRVTAVWLPDRSKASQSANTTYAYTVRTDGAVAVATSTLGPNGKYVTAYQLYDGLLRPRQTQQSAVGPDGGRIISDTLYDTAGRAARSNEAYVADGSPSTTLFAQPNDNTVPSQTVAVFDGANRPVTAILRSLGVEKWRATTVYGGDHTDESPPPGGIATTTVTDGRDRMVKGGVWNGTGYDITSYAYNTKGLLASVADPAGNKWSFGYDARGERTVANDPDKGKLTAIYDDAGRLQSTTDASGQTISYAYDNLDRLTATTSGTTKLTEWTYDTVAKGQLSTSTRYVNGNAYTVAANAYDAAYRPTRMSMTVPAAEGALAGTYTFSSTYKPDGRVATMTMPAGGGLSGETVTNTYDDLGNINTVTSGLSSYVTSTAYTRLGEPAVITYSNGGPLAQTGIYYDEATRRPTRAVYVRQTSPSTLADVNYQYDPAGNITRITDQSDTQCFTYDYERRLTEAWTPGGADCSQPRSASALGGPAPYWQSYGYDVASDRTSLVDHSAGGDVTTTYRYPASGSAQPHAVQSTTRTGPQPTVTSSYSYDGSGEPLAQQTGAQSQSFTWTAEGRLGSVTDAAGTDSYVYDASGERLLSRDANGTTLYLPGMQLHRDSANQVTGERFYTLGALTVAQRTSAGLTWLMSDHQATATVAVSANSTQSTVVRRQKPFGDARGPAAAWPNTFGFVGGTNDPTGLVHLGAREYDPAAGRFISADPVTDPTDPLQMSAYSYAADSPIIASDRSGLRYIEPPDSGQGSGQHLEHDPPAQEQACDFWCQAQRVFNNLRNQIGNAAQQAWQGLQDRLRDIGNGIQAAVDGVRDKIADAVAAAQQAANWVRDRASDVGNWARSALDAAKNAAVNIGKWIAGKAVDAGKAILGIAKKFVREATAWAFGTAVGAIVKIVCGALTALEFVCGIAAGAISGLVKYGYLQYLTGEKGNVQDAIKSVLLGVFQFVGTGLIGQVGGITLPLPGPSQPIPQPIPPMPMPPQLTH